MSRTIRMHVFTSKLFISGNTTISLSGLLPSVLAPTASLTGTSSLPLASYCVRVTGGRCPSSLYLFIALSVSLPLLSFPEATLSPSPNFRSFCPSAHSSSLFVPSSRLHPLLHCNIRGATLSSVSHRSRELHSCPRNGVGWQLLSTLGDYADRADCPRPDIAQSPSCGVRVGKTPNPRCLS